MNDVPVVTRVRHEIKRRALTVTRVEALPAGMKRVVVSGEELTGFTSLGFDDHVKLFFPDGADGKAMRDFTPRKFDVNANELWIDFFLHDAGPAAAFAKDVEVGATLQVAGPKGSAVIDPQGIDCHLLIGDETALPAIGRRLEELGPSDRAIVAVEVEPGVAPPQFESRAAFTLACVARGGGESGPAGALIASLKALQLPTERCFAWVAHETQAARALRAHLLEAGFDKKWIKASGYWRRGATGTHDKIEDAV